uniref:Uncharacterized protein n=1 Tax=Parascaris equorum TaxID=6256 RepID=A0A914S158_PAREQ
MIYERSFRMQLSWRRIIPWSFRNSSTRRRKSMWMVWRSKELFVLSAILASSFIGKLCV